MYLQIHDNMRIEELQERFSICFPQLWIEFFFRSHKKGKPSDSKHKVKPDKLLGDIRTNHTNGALEIKSWYTVAKVEQELKDNFGLNAQVYRWDVRHQFIQTVESDNLTLSEQCELGLDKP